MICNYYTLKAPPAVISPLLFSFFVVGYYVIKPSHLVKQLAVFVLFLLSFLFSFFSYINQKELCV